MAPVTIAPERCLNRRHKAVGCTLCLSCPTSALAAAGTSVRATADLCGGCGYCYSVCPTGAFTAAGPSLAALVRLVSERGHGSLEVICGQQNVEEPSDSPAASRLQVPCLAWVSSPLMLAFAALGAEPLYLDDRLCTGCRLRAVHAGITSLVTAANEILDGLGRIRVSLVSSVGTPRLRPHRVPVLDPARPAFSRRDLFGALRRSTISAAAAVAAAGPVEPATRGLGLLSPPQLALRRAALRRVAAADAGEAHAVLPLSAVTVSLKCTACGLCAKLCPTGALTMPQEDGRYALRFQAGLCVGQSCQVCAHICPVRALTVAEGVPLGETVSEEPAVLGAGVLVACSRCGALVARTEDTPLCHACRWTRNAGPVGLAAELPASEAAAPLTGTSAQG